MFKNEITLLKIFFFENFRFFSEKYFQKNGHNFFFEPIFFMNFFFSTVNFFLTRSKTPSDINVCSEEVAEKCTWKSRLRRSSPINTLIKCGKRLQVANLQESTWNFFERHFYTQKNVLNTEPGISDDIAALWKSLVVVRYMADRLYGGLRIWRTIFGVFGRFLTIFGDFERFFPENIKFFRKKSTFWPKNP